MKTTAGAVCLTVVLNAVAVAAIPLLITASGNKITGNGQVQFSIDNPGQEAARTEIFSLQGKDMGELTAQSLGHFSWDGKDVDQQPVMPGLYFVQIHHHGAVWYGPVVVSR